MQYKCNRRFYLSVEKIWIMPAINSHDVTTSIYYISTESIKW